MLRAEHPAKREMADRARPYAWPENPRRHQWFNYHNRASGVRSRDRALHKMRIRKFNLSNVFKAGPEILNFLQNPPMTYD
jgi:hypothetical protein